MTTDQSTTRRRFLKTTVATAGIALASPHIVPSSVFGATGRSAPGDRITIGMIGMGRQAYLKNMPQFLKMDDVQIVAICEVDSWRMEKAKQAIEEHYAQNTRSATYNGCATYRDYHKLLARKDIDAVMISTPDHWHTPMALDAIKAGKDVSLEKPITRTIGEGKTLLNAVKQHDRIFRVDSEFRSRANFHRAAELIRNGRLGKIHTVHVGVPGDDIGCPPQLEMPIPKELDYERWQGPAPQAPYTQKRVHPPKSYGRPGWMRHLYYGDGLITNWGAHLNGVAQWCNGSERTGPVQVEGHGKYPPADSFWNVLLEFEITYRFASGVRWIYKTDKPYIRFEGDEGWLYAAFPRGLKTEPMSILDSKIVPDEIHFPLKSDKRDFIDAVKTRQPPLEDAEVGHRTTSLCLLGNIAIQVGEKLQWDPDKEHFLNSDTANRLINTRIYTPQRT